MAMEVANIRKQFYETSLDYTMKLNDMNGLKRQEFLDSMLSMYFSECVYVDRIGQVSCNSMWREMFE
jgi:hypothetical protein